MNSISFLPRSVLLAFGCFVGSAPALYSQCCGGSAPLFQTLPALPGSEKPNCPQPAFDKVTINFNGTTAAQLQIGDTMVPLRPNEPGESYSATFTLKEFGVTAPPYSGEQVMVILKSATAAPSDPPNVNPYTGDGTAKVKTGDDPSKKSCQKEDIGTPPPTSVPVNETTVSGNTPGNPPRNSANMSQGSPPSPGGGGGAPPNGGSNPSQQGQGDPCLSPGGARPNPNNGGQTEDVLPAMMVTKVLGGNTTTNLAAGYLTWNPADPNDPGVVKPAHATNYRVRGKTDEATVLMAGNAVDRVLSPDGMTVLTQELPDKLVMRNYAPGQYDGTGVVNPGAVGFRTTTIEAITANPPTIDGYQLSNAGGPEAATATGHHYLEVEPGFATKDRLLWTGARTVGTVKHLYTHESVLLADGVSKRIWQSHSTRDTATSNDRIRTTYEILQPAAGPSITVNVIEDSFHIYSWGEEMVKRRIDPSGINQITEWSFYDPDDSDQWAFDLVRRKLQLVINPDKSWEGHVYAPNPTGTSGFDIIHTILRPWKDGPATPTAATNLAGLSTTSHRTVVTVQGGAWLSTEEYAPGVATPISKRILVSAPNDNAVEAVQQWVDATHFFETVTLRQSSTNPGDLATYGRVLSVIECKQDVHAVPANAIPSSQIIRRRDYAYSTATYATSGPYAIYAFPSYVLTDPLEVVDETVDSHLPNPMFTRTVTERESGNRLIQERYINGTDLLEIIRTFYDNNGRQVMQTLSTRQNPTVEIMTSTTDYLGDYTIRETNSNGVAKTVLDAFGRTVEQRSLGTPAKTGPLSTSAAQNDIVTTFTYAPRAVGVGYVVTETRKAVDAAGVTLTGTGGLPFSRVSSQEIDAAGRTVKTTDVYGKTLDYTYVNAATSGLIETVKFGATDIKVSSHYLDGRMSAVSGNGVIAENYDYAAAPYATSTSTTHPGQIGMITTTEDGMGRTVSESRPASLTAAGASLSATILTSYNDEGRVASRSRPNTTGGSNYEVFTYANGGRSVTSAVSTDTGWDLADTQQRRQTLTYVDEDGYWMRYML